MTRREKKVARRRARVGARVTTDYLGTQRKRRTGRRGRRLSEREKLALTDAGAGKLLNGVAKLPQPPVKGKKREDLTAVACPCRRADGSKPQHGPHWRDLGLS